MLTSFSCNYMLLLCLEFLIHLFFHSLSACCWWEIQFRASVSINRLEPATFASVSNYILSNCVFWKWRTLHFMECLIMCIASSTMCLPNVDQELLSFLALTLLSHTNPLHFSIVYLENMLNWFYLLALVVLEWFL